MPEKVTPALCCSHAWLRMFPNLLNTPEHACLYYVTISFDTSTALCVLSVDACPGGLSSRFGLGAHLPVESSYCTASASLFLCWLKSQSSCGMTQFIGLPAWQTPSKALSSWASQIILQRQAGRHDWFYYTSTRCAIPDDIAGQQRF